MPTPILILLMLASVTEAGEVVLLVASNGGTCEDSSGLCVVDDLQRAVHLAGDGGKVAVRGGVRSHAVVAGGNIEITGLQGGGWFGDPLEPDVPVISALNDARVVVDWLKFNVTRTPAFAVQDATLEIGNVEIWTSHDGRGQGLQTKASAIAAVNSFVMLEDSLINGGDVLFSDRRNPQVFLDGSTLEVRNTRFLDGAGGAIQTPRWGKGPPSTISIRGTSVFSRIGNALVVGTHLIDGRGSLFVGPGVEFSENSGNILWTGDMTMRGVTLHNNRPYSGILVYWSGAGTLDISQSLWCDNQTNGSLEASGDGVITIGSMSPSNGDRALIRNNRFVSNNRAIKLNSAEPSVGSEVASVRIEHNHFMGNVAGVGSAVLAERFFPSESVSFANNVLLSNRDFDSAGPPWVVGPSASSNLWWHNVPARSPASIRAFDSDAVIADPVITVQEADCGTPERAAIGRPSFFGATRDQGVAGLGSDGSLLQDLDGSKPDLGAWGGPWADPQEWQDADDDGVPTVYDCEPENPEVGAGLEDEPYDGLDADCRNDDDYDADDDGHRGRHPDGTPADDCDDEHGGRAPSFDEIPGNGLDDDCDGVVDEGDELRSTVGCAKTQRPTSPAAYLIALALIAAAAAKTPWRG